MSVSNISLGEQTSTSSDGSSIVIGNNASATGSLAIAIGSYDTSSSNPAATAVANSIAIGNGSVTGNDYDISIGINANALGGNSIAIGQGTDATGVSSTAVGGLAVASGDYSVAVGGAGDLTVSGNTSAGFGGGGVNTVTGNNSHAFFLTSENATLSASNLAAIIGGELVIQPVAPTGTNITSSRASFDVRATDAMIVPVGTDAQQPGQAGEPDPINGMIRYDSTSDTFKGYIGGAWKTFTLT